jgi:hypothetical protein
MSLASSCNIAIDVLVFLSLSLPHRSPRSRKALVKPELLPHLETFLPPKCAALDQAVYTPVGVAIGVACVVEPARLLRLTQGAL